MLSLTDLHRRGREPVGARVAERRRRDVCGSVHEVNGEIAAIVITVCVVISVSVRATSFRVGSNNTLPTRASLAVGPEQG